MQEHAFSLLNRLPMACRVTYHLPHTHLVSEELHLQLYAWLTADAHACTLQCRRKRTCDLEAAVVLPWTREHFDLQFAREVRRIQASIQASKQTEISAPNSLVWGLAQARPNYFSTLGHQMGLKSSLAHATIWQSAKESSVPDYNQQSNAFIAQYSPAVHL